MRVEKFKAQRADKLSKVILENFSFVSYHGLMKALRNKDVKVNGIRQSKDIKIDIGDEVVFYYDIATADNLEIIYEDKNICIINKPRKLETVSQDLQENAKDELSKQLGVPCFAVHRLDRNTIGLLIFAKNVNAKMSLDKAFKERSIEKYYLALVCGNLSKKKDDMIAYLKKDETKSRVSILSYHQAGYEKIETKYKLLNTYENFSLVEVELVTGKTHQIRAHFSFIGHPVVGDEKYGHSQINKLYKTKYQCLCSYKIVFHFNEGDYLSYLDGKCIELDKRKIDFLSKL